MADLADNIGFGDDAGQQPVGIADDDEITIEVAQKCRGLNERCIVADCDQSIARDQAAFV